MDKRTIFIELSALLTGMYTIIDPVNKQQNESTADEYMRKLTGEFPSALPRLLSTYERLSSIVPKPDINDQLLGKLKVEPEFAESEVLLVARQIVNIWYFSQFNTASGAMVDGGFYERGLVWPLVKAHPIGYSDQPFGYWAKEPKI
jgi:hypothetical protein